MQFDKNNKGASNKVVCCRFWFSPPQLLNLVSSCQLIIAWRSIPFWASLFSYYSCVQYLGQNSLDQYCDDNCFPELKKMLVKPLHHIGACTDATIPLDSNKCHL